MEKRFSTIAAAISAAFLLAACSQTDVLDDMSSVQTGNPDDNAVSFSTYTAKKGTTRVDGTTDYSNMTTAQLKRTGFGVFAYYTKDKKYGEFRNESNSYPNFMYNQEVTYSSGENWTYKPLKYWPNDFVEGDVDLKDPAAQGSGTNGYVSFFAYAPFVTSASGDYGITGITSNSTAGDPKITYTLAPDENGKYIDLLWGTFDPSTANVVGTSNSGTTGVADAGSGTYAEEVLDGQIVATDLTKQATDKQVKFLFKHALAGIGGSTKTVVTDPDDEEEVNNNKKEKSGFLVVLDIDNSTDGETTTGKTGGYRQQFNKETGSSATNSTDGAYYRTIVTIKNITIKNVESTTVNKDVEGDGDTETEEATASGTLYKKGTLNLATGQWDIFGDEDDEETSDEDKYEFEQTVGETEESSATSYALNPAIAEYKEAGTKYFPTIAANTGIPTDAEKSSILEYFKKISENDHTGVTETKLNVYEDAGVAPILLFPGSDPILQVSVEYVVRQYDDALATTYTEITNKITKDVIFPKVKLNTHYTLVMHLGLTSVKFTAEVSQWDEYDNPDDDKSTTPGEDEKRDDGIEVGSGFGEIYLPSNVVSKDTKETTTVTTTTQD